MIYCAPWFKKDKHHWQLFAINNQVGESLVANISRYPPEIIIVGWISRLGMTGESRPPQSIQSNSFTAQSFEDAAAKIETILKQIGWIILSDRFKHFA